jgi:hypothetical protein
LKILISIVGDHCPLWRLPPKYTLGIDELGKSDNITIKSCMNDGLKKNKYTKMVYLYPKMEFLCPCDSVSKIFNTTFLNLLDIFYRLIVGFVKDIIGLTLHQLYLPLSYLKLLIITLFIAPVISGVNVMVYVWMM